MNYSNPTSIQIIASSATAKLIDAGVPSKPLGAAPRLRTADFLLHGQTAEAGIWECEAGSFRRQVARPEVMHLLQGRCTFQVDGELPVEFVAGDSFFFPGNTQGTWEIIETVRKLYVIL